MTNDVYWRAASVTRLLLVGKRQEARGEIVEGERESKFWFIIVFLLVSVYCALMQAQNVLKKICVAHIEVVPGVQAVADGGEICQPRTQPSPAAPRSVNSGQQTTLSG